MIIDIIIPTLNESENLKKLIPYLKEQLINAEAKIIVVDSIQSKDETKSICLQNDVIYLNSERSQRAFQMNLGYLNSKADAFMFLHADVFPPSNFYIEIENCLHKNHCGMFAYRFDRGGIKLWINSFFTQFDSFYSGGGDQCLFFKRETFERLKGFDESFEVMEDFEIFRRIKKENFRYTILGEKALVSARKYSANSYLKVNWINLKMISAFLRGESAKDLKRLYDQMKNQLN